MARKTLSSQVMEEVDRARGLLKPVQSIVDPMTSHMVGAVLESLHRIDTMCLAARQSAVNEALAPSPLEQAFQGDKLSELRTRGSKTTHKAPRTRKAASE